MDQLNKAILVFYRFTVNWQNPPSDSQLLQTDHSEYPACRYLTVAT
ncbi:MAG: hypothetical protein Q4D85_08885 [Corynebacterium sp.]|nr:hypothetical protein [Corynebacterium sp.]MDO5098862.1 hypothetical protein [Corynebacterium sp.]